MASLLTLAFSYFLNPFVVLQVEVSSLILNFCFSISNRSTYKLQKEALWWVEQGSLDRCHL